MDKLKMQTANRADENYQKLAELFPNAVTETIDEDGDVIRVIDEDVLMQEINTRIIVGKKERYQFTWPDKRKSVLLSNAPINKTLRPCRSESVGKDGTPGGFDSENLYIEGDNLEVLKLLQETYLGKIKMIYIDPPYNTGNDFVYNDDFAQSMEDYKNNSGQYDDEGNRLFHNTESNGRFHTDWLNMMYPRLRLARDLLSDDGAIFISIDDNEQANLKKIGDEIFGESNFVATFPWRKRTAKSDVPFGVSQDYEWILCYSKSSAFYASVEGKQRRYYETPDFPGKPWRIHDMTTQRTAHERPNSFFTMINPKTGEKYPCDPDRTWRVTKDTFQKYYDSNEIIFPGDYDFLKISKPVARYFKENDIKKAGDNFGRVALSTKFADDIGMSQDGTKEIKSIFSFIPFSFPKTIKLLKYLINAATNKDSLILDFFSGSAATAHAVIQLNAEDNGNRKFIMVQLPEPTDEKSEAYKAGYKNICEIGKERIRRAGKKIKNENSQQKLINDETHPELDIGFRVLKCDTSNIRDVSDTPANTVNKLLTDVIDNLTDNIKDDRTPEDLLFQSMLMLGIPLSYKIEEMEIADKKVFSVFDNFLIACFDEDINKKTIEEIAKMKPQYFVTCDRSMTDDNVRTNFERILNTYSKDTVWKVI